MFAYFDIELAICDKELRVGKISSPLSSYLLYGLMPLKEVITDMNNQTKRYKDDNGDFLFFDVEKFKSIIDLNVRTKETKKEEYLRELAEELSCGYDTLVGWKKGRNAPQDLELVHSLENTLGVSQNSLLYSTEKKLKKELNKAQNMNAELVLENSGLKRRLEQEKLKNDDIDSTKDSSEEKYSFCGQLTPYNLRYEGFSNLIDLLLGKCYEKDAIEDISSTYAEELSYILNDYIYKYSFAELIGFNGCRSKEEYESYRNEHNTNSDDDFLRWIEEAIVDSSGNRLYDENRKITLKGIDLFKRLRDGTIFNESDSLRVRALLDELIDKWDNFICPYALIGITIAYDDIVINRYTFGEGFVQPTNDDRMDIVNELLFLTNGDISKYSLENVKKFHADQFEYEIEVVYDLKNLI